jgi:hypothetical protein
MAVDIINGVSYHSDQVREVLAKAYLDALDLLNVTRDLHTALDKVPRPITIEDWRRTHPGSMDWPKCEHGVLKAADGKSYCTRCMHE